MADHTCAVALLALYEGEPSPYIGGYMFQFMSEEEIADYVTILTRDFKNVFHKDDLAKSAKERVALAPLV